MTVGAKILGTQHVDSTVISTIAGLQVEGTFPTGTHLVTVDHPVSTKDGNLEMAMYGSCLTPPPPEIFPSDDLLEDDNRVESRPGAIVCAQSGGIKLREGRPRRIVRVVNRGDRAIQVRLLRLPNVVISPIVCLPRSARIFILSKPILTWNSTDSKPTAITLTYPPALRSVSSPEKPKQSHCRRSGG